jgi:hypothetical protein
MAPNEQITFYSELQRPLYPLKADMLKVGSDVG